MKMRHIKKILFFACILGLTTTSFGMMRKLNALLSKNELNEKELLELSRVLSGIGQGVDSRAAVKKKFDAIMKLEAPTEKQIELAEKLANWHPQLNKSTLELHKKALKAKPKFHVPPTRPIPPTPGRKFHVPPAGSVPKVPFKAEFQKVEDELEKYKAEKASAKYAPIIEKIDNKIRSLDASLIELEEAEDPEAPKHRKELDRIKAVVQKARENKKLGASAAPSAPPYEEMVLEPEVPLMRDIDITMQRLSNAVALDEKYNLLVQLDKEFKAAHARQKSAEETKVLTQKEQAFKQNIRAIAAEIRNKHQEELAGATTPETVEELETQYKSLSKMLTERGERGGLRPIAPAPSTQLRVPPVIVE